MAKMKHIIYMLNSSRHLCVPRHLHHLKISFDLSLTLNPAVSVLQRISHDSSMVKVTVGWQRRWTHWWSRLTISR
jgi:hypothetical protein